MTGTGNSSKGGNVGNSGNGNHAMDYRDLALSSGSEGLFLVDCNNQVVFCNPQLEKLLETQQNAIIARNHGALFNQIAALSSDSAKMARDLAAALEKVEEKPIVTIVLHPPRTGRFQLQLFPFRDDQKTYRNAGWGGILRDVSTQERGISQDAKYLSLLIRELRVSLAEISGFASTLLDSHESWEVDERDYFLANISEGVDQLGQFLENAQDLFKLETGEVRLEHQPSAPKALVQHAIRSLGARANGYHFDINVPEDLPMIEIDLRLATRVLCNILGSMTNRASVEETVQITAQVDLDEVVIGMTDQGMVISEDQLSHIFEPFYRTSTSAGAGVENKKRSLGSGMNLYTAYQLILAHGGRIRVESNPSGGTTFYCAFPVKARAAEPVRLLTSSASPMTRPKVPARTKSRRPFMRALVVDDDFQIAQYLRAVLERSGFQVLVARNGTQAVSLAVEKRPQIILLDLSLPDIDGLAVCTQIREVLSVPIIMVTANSRRETAMRALDAGADDYIVKPIESDELLARVRAVLRRTSNSALVQGSPAIQIGELYIDFNQRQVSIKGNTVKLTPTEFKLLYVLADNAGRVLSHSQLLSAVWGPEYIEEKEYLWVHINRLRKKLEDDPANPQYILTEPSIGYHLPESSSPSWERTGLT